MPKHKRHYGSKHMSKAHESHGLEGDIESSKTGGQDPVGVSQYRYGSGADGKQMINNDRSKVANMPSEIMNKMYPENPSYFPDTEIDDSMRGIDAKSKRANMNPNYIKGQID